MSLPLSRRDVCPECGVELHVCRMCVHYAPSAPNACDEDDAIEVQNKTAANFCDYFSPSPDVYDGSEKFAENVARAELDALFGNAAPAKGEREKSAEADPLLRQAEDLFRK